MVKVSDCSCECRDKGKEKMIEERALSSVNKILSTEGTPYYPDGTGAITMPVANVDDLQNAAEVPAIKQEIKQMKISAAETDEAVTVLEGVADDHAREIQALKSGSGDQSKEIAAIESRVADTEAKTGENEAAIAAIEATDTQQTKDIASVTSRVGAVEGKAAVNSADIAEIRTTDVTQGQQISALQTLTNSITKSLITSVEVKNGTDNGSFMVNVIEEDGTKRTSNNYQYGKIASFELIQGTQAGYVRGRLTLVDGTEIVSNDFQILQITATDVYVTSITLQGDYQKGQIKGEIGYSNGNTAQIDPIDVPTAPGVTVNIEALLSRMSSTEASIKTQGTDIAGLKTRVEAAETDITGLKIRMSAAESKSSAQDGEISALDQRVQAIEDTPGIGKFSNSKEGTILGSTAAGKVGANADGTGSVNGWDDKADVSALDATDAEVAKKANQSDLAALQTAVQDCFNEVTYDSATNKLTFTALDGQSNAFTLKGADFPPVFFEYERKTNPSLTSSTDSNFIRWIKTAYGGINGSNTALKTCADEPTLIYNAVVVPSASKTSGGNDGSSDATNIVFNKLKENFKFSGNGLAIFEILPFTDHYYEQYNKPNHSYQCDSISNDKAETYTLLINILNGEMTTLDSRSDKVYNRWFNTNSDSSYVNHQYIKLFAIVSISYNKKL